MIRSPLLLVIVVYVLAAANGLAVDGPNLPNWVTWVVWIAMIPVGWWAARFTWDDSR